MIRDWYQGISESAGPLIGLVVFFGLFLIVLVYVISAMRDRNEVDRMAALPLDDEASETTSHGGNPE